LEEKIETKEAKKSSLDEKFKATDIKAKEMAEKINELENDSPEME